jgi:hypothetical protein
MLIKECIPLVLDSYRALFIKHKNLVGLRYIVGGYTSLSY